CSEAEPSVVVRGTSLSPEASGSSRLSPSPPTPSNRAYVTAPQSERRWVRASVCVCVCVSIEGESECVCVCVCVSGLGWCVCVCQAWDGGGCVLLSPTGGTVQGRCWCPLESIGLVRQGWAWGE